MATLDLSDRPYRECPKCGRGVTGTLAQRCGECDAAMELHRPGGDTPRH